MVYLIGGGGGVGGGGDCYRPALIAVMCGDPAKIGLTEDINE